MRHTNLGTTRNYMMAVNEHMQAAVRNLDVTAGAVLLESAGPQKSLRL